MCNRYALWNEYRDLAGAFPEVDFSNVQSTYKPRYNVGLKTQVLAVTNDAHNSALRAEWVRWQFVPGWSKTLDLPYATFNVRSEEVASKPAYRAAWKAGRRCAFFANGFIDWEERAPKKKFPHLFQLADQSLFGLAGIWEDWKDPADGRVVRTAAIMTVEPNALVGCFHHRMPVLLAREQLQAWLGSGADPEASARILRPLAPELMREREISTYVNKVGNEGPEVLAAPGSAA